MAQTSSLTGILITDGLPVLVSSLIFALLLTVFGPNVANLLKAAYIAVIIIGVWNLLIRKGRDRFSSRLFHCMAAFGVAASLAIQTSSATIQGFNAKVSTGLFVPDMILGNLLYMPWAGYATTLASYLVIYGCYHGIKNRIGQS